jgi:hypothetical protein
MFWANDLVLAFGITAAAIAIIVSVACYVWMDAQRPSRNKKVK